jgi:superfamily II DNA or RNA helicase
MSDKIKSVPSVSVTYARNGATKANALGMRPMQERAYEKRGEQYLLIKSPPASGKSRALMFVALDKLKNQGIKQAIIVVPEKSIGASFNDEPLSKYGFWSDWQVEPKWNLCNAPGNDNGGKVKSLGAFLEGDDKVLVCTHATFRFAVDAYGVEAFDDRLIAVDEFHHVSANPTTSSACTWGSSSRGQDAHRRHDRLLLPGRRRGRARPRTSPSSIPSPTPTTNSSTATSTSSNSTSATSSTAGLTSMTSSMSSTRREDHHPHPQRQFAREHEGQDAGGGTHHRGAGRVAGHRRRDRLPARQAPDGRVLRIADLVDDDAAKRDRVSAALKDPAQKNNRDHVDIIIALGMAKEGFDWIWCEHALTVGYRASLTEIVQIIGRATRDAPGKTRARFTNLIAEPDATEEAVTEAVNDTLKAIAASLLMEQVLAPRFEFKPKNPDSGPTPGFTMARVATTRTAAMSASMSRQGRTRSRSRASPNPRAKRRRASARKT